MEKMFKKGICMPLSECIHAELKNHSTNTNGNLLANISNRYKKQ